MKNSIIIFIVILLLVLAGCELRSTKITPMELASVKRVGIIFNADDKPVQAHDGNGSKFVIEKNIDWGIRKEATEFIKTILDQKYSFTFVEIPTSPSLVESRFEMIDSFGNPAPKLVWELERIASENELDLIITIQPFFLALKAGGRMGADGYGLYTHCYRQTCKARPLTYISTAIFFMKPFKRLTSRGAGLPGEPIDVKFQSPEGDLTDAEFNKARPYVISRIQKCIRIAFIRAGLLDEQ